MKTLYDWLTEAPFALALSSGFFGFYAHAGVIAGLESASLRPRMIAGSSAGALVGGLWAAGLSAERQRDVLLGLRRGDFWDPGRGYGVLRGGKFQRLLESLIADTQVEATGTPFRASTFDVWSAETRVHTSGSLTDVLRASCAVPVMFHPVMIDSRPQLDGGICDRPGLRGLIDEPRVLYHHLQSRAPWRVAVPHPSRTGLAVVTFGAIPRPDPFRLKRGVAALERARDAMLRALEPVRDARSLATIG
jgi:NTE family protein